MASLSKEGGGKKPKRVVEFAKPHGGETKIRLGRIGLREAEAFKAKVEALIACVKVNVPPDHELATWLAGLPDKTYGKLAVRGLVPPRHTVGLRDWLARYVEQRTDLKPASIVKLKQTQGWLLAFFGPEIPIREITVSRAKDWRVWLTQRRKKRPKKDPPLLSEAYVCQQCRNAKALLQEAVERGMIQVNPFKGLRSESLAADREYYVTPEVTDRILETCPCLAWRVLVGLGRLAGLRVPSETHLLT